MVTTLIDIHQFIIMTLRVFIFKTSEMDFGTSC